MLATGRTTLPSRGIGAITQQLAAPLKAEGRVRCSARVEALVRDSDCVVGVRLANGDVVHGEAVVVAVEAPGAAKLMNAVTPTDVRQTTVVYFTGSRRLYRSRKIVLNAAADAFVNNAQQVTNVAPSYAPPGRHLLGVTILGTPEMDDRSVVVRAIQDLRRMFAGSPPALGALETYAPLRVERIAYAQFPQLPGVYGTLPANRTPERGLYIAAEWTESSSINGALTSGELCATVVRQDLMAA